MPTPRRSKALPADTKARASAAPRKVDKAPAAPARDGRKPRVLDPAALDELAGYCLRRADVAMRQHFAGALAEWDIRGAEYSVLVLVGGNEMVTQAELGEALSIKRPNMVKLIERLEQRGLIARRVHEQDRRNHILSLTAAGRTLLKRVDGVVHGLDDRVTRCWTARERAQVISLLRRFYRYEPGSS